jgi:muramoyltetrapeptide carboxypeptidase
MKINIRLITPSWLVKSRKEFQNGIRGLEKAGFAILNKKHILKPPTPSQKARDIHAAFLDNRSDIILASRGGYSSMKVLPHINFNLIKKHQKTFAGFSDISTLLNLIYERTGIVTLHSPMLINFSPLRRFTLNSFLNALHGFPEKDLIKNAQVKIFHPGTARGTLKGGNLVTLTALTGTPWDIKTDGCILFLEDVDEKIHEVDRCLTQWIFAGKFEKIRGLVLGDFRGIEPGEVYKIISRQLKIRFPVIHTPFIGHVKNKITLPVGARVELNTVKRSLTLL